MLAILTCIFSVSLVMGLSTIMVSYVRDPRYHLTIPVVVIGSLLIALLAFNFCNTIYGGFEMYEINHHNEAYVEKIETMKHKVQLQEANLNEECSSWAKQRSLPYLEEENVDAFISEHPDALLSYGFDYLKYKWDWFNYTRMDNKQNNRIWQMIYYWPI